MLKIMRNKRLLFIVSVVSSLIVLISPFLTSETVNNADDLKTVAFGFPIPFVIQDLSAYDPPFPYEMSLSSSLESYKINQCRFFIRFHT